MKVLHGEGVAIHTGPESCAGAGDRTREALTGGRAGRVLSREKGTPSETAGRLERRRCRATRKATLRGPLARGTRGLRAVRDPEHARTHLVRKPGDPMVVWSSEPDRTGNPKGARR
jgi:hypothetical protein